MKNFTLKKVSVLTAGLILFGLLSAAKAQTNYQIDEAATAASPLKPGTRIAMYYAGRDKETNQSIVRIFQGVTTQGLYLVQEFITTACTINRPIPNLISLCPRKDWKMSEIAQIFTTMTV